ncbi:MAG: low-specificity L-threonine aldolase [Anaerolineae bacterium]|nr:low-specificity L-threonine aldolase [Anaerolineae bacterium]
MHVIDLRSDTVTHPTPEMREAMAHAVVGDDVYGEDPTVNRLEEMAATRLGKEAALFVVSGTMGNLASLLAHCGRGDEVIMGDRSHTFLHEQGGLAALGSIMPFVVPNQHDGTLLLGDIENAIRGADIHEPRTRLVSLENTQNACNGSPLTPAYVASVADLAHRYGLRVHVDGARIFNAAVALGTDVKALVAGVDSVTFCLSKGLAAPVGSMICGSGSFIGLARRARKVLGGGMRQAGILAAAGIVALETMVDRLADDHTRASNLARGLAALPGVSVGPVYTNIFYFSLDAACPLDGAAFADALRERGILLPNRGPRSFRVVTHCWIDDEDVERTLAAAVDVLGLA